MSYISLSEAVNYLANKVGSEPFLNATPELQQKALDSAVAIIDTIKFKGYTKEIDQDGQWPRLGIVDSQGRLYPEIPKAVKYANAQLAVTVIQTNGTLTEETSSKGSKKVIKAGPLETEFFEFKKENQSGREYVPNFVYDMLKDFISTKSSALNITLERA